eukprot:1341748-Lingulodinium_polyedra.AAC.1
MSWAIAGTRLPKTSVQGTLSTSHSATPSTNTHRGWPLSLDAAGATECSITTMWRKCTRWGLP